MMRLTRTGSRSAELARELGISHALAGRHLRRLVAVGLVEPAEARPGPSGHGLPGEGDAELWLSPDAWDDFRHRLAARLVTLHEQARAPHTAGTVRAGAVRMGATVMAFPSLPREREREREKSPGHRR